MRVLMSVGIALLASTAFAQTQSPPQESYAESIKCLTSNGTKIVPNMKASGVLTVNSLGASSQAFTSQGVLLSPVLAGTGTKWLRAQMRWSDVDNGSGSYDWSKFDLQLQYIPAGTKLLVLLNGPIPADIVSSAGGSPQQATLTSAFASRWPLFVKAAVERYTAVQNGNVAAAAWEIWNEPGTPDDPSDAFRNDLLGYRERALRPAVAAIRASSNANAFVVAPALGTYYSDPTRINSSLNASLGTLSDGTLVAVDGVSLHAYRAPSNIIQIGQAARAWENAQAKPTLPLWLSEYGKDSGPDTSSDPYSGEVAQVCHFREFQWRAASQFNPNNAAQPLFDWSSRYTFLDQSANEQYGLLAQVNSPGHSCTSLPNATYYTKLAMSEFQYFFNVSQTSRGTCY